MILNKRRKKLCYALIKKELRLQHMRAQRRERLDCLYRWFVYSGEDLYSNHFWMTKQYNGAQLSFDFSFSFSFTSSFSIAKAPNGLEFILGWWEKEKASYLFQGDEFVVKRKKLRPQFELSSFSTEINGM